MKTKREIMMRKVRKMTDENKVEVEEDVEYLAKNIGDCKLCRFGLDCAKISRVVKEIVIPGVTFRCPIAVVPRTSLLDVPLPLGEQPKDKKE